MKFIVSAVLAAVFCMSQATAATVDQFVNESAAGSGGFPSGGDYADTAGQTGRNDLGNIRLGTTQISGDLRVSRGDFADWFFFDVRADRKVVSATLTTPVTGNVTPVVGLAIADDMGSLLVFESATAGGTIDLFANLPGGLGAGKYNVGLFFVGSQIGDQDWSIQARLVETPAVPLPAGLPLLLAGLGGLAILRRRA